MRVPASQPQHTPSAAELRATFDQGQDHLVGIEDEVMLLDPDTLELTPQASEVLARLEGDQRFKLELPRSQLEIITAPAETVRQAASQLLEARREAAGRAGDLVRLAAGGVHPFSPGQGELNQLERYRPTIVEFGPIAQRQLVCATQVHVSVAGAERALAVYNAARSYLPLLAALAANGAFYEGRDSGLASVRPKLCELLPRQGVPSAFDSWEKYAETLAWGATSRRFDSRTWWWELRPHPGFGTLEFRVPDAQPTVAEVAAVAAVAQSLVAWLATRHDRGERLASAPVWRIEENRWSTCRDGVEGTMADLGTGAPRSTRTCLNQLLDALEPVAHGLGAGEDLGRARELVARNGALMQRETARQNLESVHGAALI